MQHKPVLEMCEGKLMQIYNHRLKGEGSFFPDPPGAEFIYINAKSVLNTHPYLDFNGNPEDAWLLFDDSEMLQKKNKVGKRPRRPVNDAKLDLARHERQEPVSAAGGSSRPEAVPDPGLHKRQEPLLAPAHHEKPEALLAEKSGPSRYQVISSKVPSGGFLKPGQDDDIDDDPRKSTVQKAVVVPQLVSATASGDHKSPTPSDTMSESDRHSAKSESVDKSEKPGRDRLSRERDGQRLRDGKERRRSRSGVRRGFSSSRDSRRSRSRNRLSGSRDRRSKSRELSSSRPRTPDRERRRSRERERRLIYGDRIQDRRQTSRKSSEPPKSTEKNLREAGSQRSYTIDSQAGEKEKEELLKSFADRLKAKSSDKDKTLSCVRLNSRLEDTKLRRGGIAPIVFTLKKPEPSFGEKKLAIGVTKPQDEKKAELELEKLKKSAEQMKGKTDKMRSKIGKLQGDVYDTGEKKENLMSLEITKLQADLRETARKLKEKLESKQSAIASTSSSFKPTPTTSVITPSTPSPFPTAAIPLPVPTPNPARLQAVEVSVKKTQEKKKNSPLSSTSVADTTSLGALPFVQSLQPDVQPSNTYEQLAGAAIEYAMNVQTYGAVLGQVTPDMHGLGPPPALGLNPILGPPHGPPPGHPHGPPPGHPHGPPPGHPHGPSPGHPYGPSPGHPYGPPPGHPPGHPHGPPPGHPYGPPLSHPGHLHGLPPGHLHEPPPGYLHGPPPGHMHGPPPSLLRGPPPRHPFGSGPGHPPGRVLGPPQGHPVHRMRLLGPEQTWEPREQHPLFQQGPLQFHDWYLPHSVHPEMMPGPLEKVGSVKTKAALVNRSNLVALGTAPENSSNLITSSISPNNEASIVTFSAPQLITKKPEQPAEVYQEPVKMMIANFDEIQFFASNIKFHQSHSGLNEQIKKMKEGPRKDSHEYALKHGIFCKVRDTSAEDSPLLIVVPNDSNRRRAVVTAFILRYPDWTLDRLIELFEQSFCNLPMEDIEDAFEDENTRKGTVPLLLAKTQEETANSVPMSDENTQPIVTAKPSEEDGIKVWDSELKMRLEIMSEIIPNIRAWQSECQELKVIVQKLQEQPCTDYLMYQDILLRIDQAHSVPRVCLGEPSPEVKDAIIACLHSHFHDVRFKDFKKTLKSWFLEKNMLIDMRSHIHRLCPKCKDSDSVKTQTDNQKLPEPNEEKSLFVAAIPGSQCVALPSIDTESKTNDETSESGIVGAKQVDDSKQNTSTKPSLTGPVVCEELGLQSNVEVQATLSLPEVKPKLETDENGSNATAERGTIDGIEVSKELAKVEGKLVTINDEITETLNIDGTKEELERMAEIEEECGKEGPVAEKVVEVGERSQESSVSDEPSVVTNRDSQGLELSFGPGAKSQAYEIGKLKSGVTEESKDNAASGTIEKAANDAAAVLQRDFIVETELGDNSVDKIVTKVNSVEQEATCSTVMDEKNEAQVSDSVEVPSVDFLSGNIPMPVNSVELNVAAAEENPLLEVYKRDLVGSNEQITVKSSEESREEGIPQRMVEKDSEANETQEVRKGGLIEEEEVAKMKLEDEEKKEHGTAESENSRMISESDGLQIEFKGEVDKVEVEPDALECQSNEVAKESADQIKNSVEVRQLNEMPGEVSSGSVQKDSKENVVGIHILVHPLTDEKGGHVDIPEQDTLSPHSKADVPEGLLIESAKLELITGTESTPDDAGKNKDEEVADVGIVIQPSKEEFELLDTSEPLRLCVTSKYEVTSVVKLESKGDESNEKAEPVTIALESQLHQITNDVVGEADDSGEAQLSADRKIAEVTPDGARKGYEGEDAGIGILIPPLKGESEVVDTSEPVKPCMEPIGEVANIMQPESKGDESNEKAEPATDALETQSHQITKDVVVEADDSGEAEGSADGTVAEKVTLDDAEKGKEGEDTGIDILIPPLKGESELVDTSEPVKLFMGPIDEVTNVVKLESKGDEGNEKAEPITDALETQSHQITKDVVVEADDSGEAEGSADGTVAEKVTLDDAEKGKEGEDTGIDILIPPLKGESELVDTSEPVKLFMGPIDEVTNVVKLESKGDEGNEKAEPVTDALETQSHQITKDVVVEADDSGEAEGSADGTVAEKVTRDDAEKGKEGEDTGIDILIPPLKGESELVDTSEPVKLFMGPIDEVTNVVKLESKGDEGNEKAEPATDALETQSHKITKAVVVEADDSGEAEGSADGTVAEKVTRDDAEKGKEGEDTGIDILIPPLKGESELVDTSEPVKLFMGPIDEVTNVVKLESKGDEGNEKAEPATDALETQSHKITKAVVAEAGDSVEVEGSPDGTLAEEVTLDDAEKGKEGEDAGVSIPIIPMTGGSELLDTSGPVKLCVEPVDEVMSVVQSESKGDEVSQKVEPGVDTPETQSNRLTKDTAEEASYSDSSDEKREVAGVGTVTQSLKGGLKGLLDQSEPEKPSMNMWNKGYSEFKVDASTKEAKPAETYPKDITQGASQEDEDAAEERESRPQTEDRKESVEDEGAAEERESRPQTEDGKESDSAALPVHIIVDKKSITEANVPDGSKAKKEDPSGNVQMSQPLESPEVSSLQEKGPFEQETPSLGTSEAETLLPKSTVDAGIMEVVSGSLPGLGSASAQAESLMQEKIGGLDVSSVSTAGDKVNEEIPCTSDGGEYIHQPGTVAEDILSDAVLKPGNEPGNEISLNTSPITPVVLEADQLVSEPSDTGGEICEGFEAHKTAIMQVELSVHVPANASENVEFQNTSPKNDMKDLESCNKEHNLLESSKPPGWTEVLEVVGESQINEPELAEVLVEKAVTPQDPVTTDLPPKPAEVSTPDVTGTANTEQESVIGSGQVVLEKQAVDSILSQGNTIEEPTKVCHPKKKKKFETLQEFILSSEGGKYQEPDSLTFVNYERLSFFFERLREIQQSTSELLSIINKITSTSFNSSYDFVVKNGLLGKRKGQQGKELFIVLLKSTATYREIVSALTEQYPDLDFSEFMSLIDSSFAYVTPAEITIIHEFIKMKALSNKYQQFIDKCYIVNHEALQSVHLHLINAQKRSDKLKILMKTLEVNYGIAEQYILKDRLICSLGQGMYELKVVAPEMYVLDFAFIIKTLHSKFHDKSLEELKQMLLETFDGISFERYNLPLVLSECSMCKIMKNQDSQKVPALLSLPRHVLIKIRQFQMSSSVLSAQIDLLSKGQSRAGSRYVLESNLLCKAVSVGDQKVFRVVTPLSNTKELILMLHTYFHLKPLDEFFYFIQEFLTVSRGTCEEVLLDCDLCKSAQEKPTDQQEVFENKPTVQKESSKQEIFMPDKSNASSGGRSLGRRESSSSNDGSDAIKSTSESIASNESKKSRRAKGPWKRVEMVFGSGSYGKLMLLIDLVRHMLRDIRQWQMESKQSSSIIKVLNSRYVKRGDKHLLFEDVLIVTTDEKGDGKKFKIVVKECPNINYMLVTKLHAHYHHWNEKRLVQTINTNFDVTVTIEEALSTIHLFCDSCKKQASSNLPKIQRKAKASIDSELANFYSSINTPSKSGNKQLMKCEKLGRKCNPEESPKDFAVKKTELKKSLEPIAMVVPDIEKLQSECKELGEVISKAIKADDKVWQDYMLFENLLFTKIIKNNKPHWKIVISTVPNAMALLVKIFHNQYHDMNVNVLHNHLALFDLRVPRKKLVEYILELCPKCKASGKLDKYLELSDQKTKNTGSEADETKYGRFHAELKTRLVILSKVVPKIRAWQSSCQELKAIVMKVREKPSLDYIMYQDILFKVDQDHSAPRICLGKPSSEVKDAIIACLHSHFHEVRFKEFKKTLRSWFLENSMLIDVRSHIHRLCSKCKNSDSEADETKYGRFHAELKTRLVILSKVVPKIRAWQSSCQELKAIVMKVREKPSPDYIMYQDILFKVDQDHSAPRICLGEPSSEVKDAIIACLHSHFHEVRFKEFKKTLRSWFLENSMLIDVRSHIHRLCSKCKNSDSIKTQSEKPGHEKSLKPDSGNPMGVLLLEKLCDQVIEENSRSPATLSPNVAEASPVAGPSKEGSHRGRNVAIRGRKSRVDMCRVALTRYEIPHTSDRVILLSDESLSRPPAPKKARVNEKSKADFLAIPEENVQRADRKKARKIRKDQLDDEDSDSTPAVESNLKEQKPNVDESVDLPKQQETPKDESAISDEESVLKVKKRGLKAKFSDLDGDSEEDSSTYEQPQDSKDAQYTRGESTSSQHQVQVSEVVEGPKTDSVATVASGCCDLDVKVEESEAYELKIGNAYSLSSHQISKFEVSVKEPDTAMITADAGGKNSESKPLRKRAHSPKMQKAVEPTDSSADENVNKRQRKCPIEEMAIDERSPVDLNEKASPRPQVDASMSSTSQPALVKSARKRGRPKKVVSVEYCKNSDSSSSEQEGEPLEQKSGVPTPVKKQNKKKELRRVLKEIHDQLRAEDSSEESCAETENSTEYLSKQIEKLLNAGSPQPLKDISGTLGKDLLKTELAEPVEVSEPLDETKGGNP